MLLFGKPASHILVGQPIGLRWHIPGSETHKWIQLCENNFREYPFYYEGLLLPSFLLFLTLKTNPKQNQLDTKSDETGFSELDNLTNTNTTQSDTFVQSKAGPRSVEQQRSSIAGDASCLPAAFNRNGNNMRYSHS